MNVHKLDMDEFKEEQMLWESNEKRFSSSVPHKNRKVDIDSDLFNYFEKNHYDLYVDKDKSSSFFIKNDNTKFSCLRGYKWSEYSFESSNDESNIYLEYYLLSEDNPNIYLNMKLVTKDGKMYLIHTTDCDKKLFGGKKQNIDFYCCYDDENENEPLKCTLIHNPSWNDKNQLFYDIIYSYLNDGLKKFEEISNEISNNNGKSLKRKINLF